MDLFILHQSTVPMFLQDPYLWFLLIGTFVIRVYDRGTLDERNRMKVLFEHCSDGIIILDSQQRVISANPAAEQLTGWNDSELLTQSSCQDVLRCRSETGEELCLSCPFTVEALSGRGPISYYEMMVTGRGQAVPVTASACLLPFLLSGFPRGPDHARPAEEEGAGG